MASFEGGLGFSETEQFLGQQIHLTPYTIVVCEIQGWQPMPIHHRWQTFSTPIGLTG